MDKKEVLCINIYSTGGGAAGKEARWMMRRVRTNQRRVVGMEGGILVGKYTFLCIMNTTCLSRARGPCGLSIIIITDIVTVIIFSLG